MYMYVFMYKCMYVAMYVTLRSRYQPYHAGHIYFMCGTYTCIRTC